MCILEDYLNSSVTLIAYMKLMLASIKGVIASLTFFVVFLSLTSFSDFAHSPSAATCNGAKNCRACKNCKYCKHCAKEGGTCGVCRK